MRKNKTLINVVSILVIVALAASLAVIIVRDNQKKAQIIAANQERAARDREREIRNRDAGPEIYSTLLSELEDAIPGIVCWGDESIIGNDAGYLPRAVKIVADETIYEAFKNNLARVSKMYETKDLQMPVAIMGITDEGWSEMMVRMGVRQMVLRKDHVIPASTAVEELPVTDDFGNALIFAKQRFAKFDKASIGDVEGLIYIDEETTEEMQSNLTFARDEAGEEVKVSAGTPIHTEGAEEYRGYVPILYFAERRDVTTDQLTRDIRAFAEAYGPDAYVVICTTEADSEWDKALRSAAGDHYLRSDKPVDGMEEADFDQLAQRAFEKLKAQGAFDGVLEAIAKAQASLDALEARED